MSISLDHLDEDVREIAQLDAEARVEYINERSLWIGHPDAKRAEASLLEVVRPSKARKHAALIGPPGSGKTLTIRDVFGISDLVIGSPPWQGVLNIQMPHEPDEEEFLENTAEALGGRRAYIPYNLRYLRMLRNTVWMRIKTLQPRIVIIEDLQLAGVGTDRNQRKFVQLIRTLVIKSKASLIVTGTRDALNILQLDEQLYNRTVEIPLDPLNSEQTIKAIARAAIRMLPLRRPSPLDDVRIGRILMTLSGGNMGRLIDGIKGAAIDAVDTGTEMVSFEGLRDSSGWPRLLRSRHLHSIASAANV